jgi:hypothetical protein
MSYAKSWHLPDHLPRQLHDSLINLNTFFMITGVIILINMTYLELGWPPDLPEWSHQSAEPTSPCWGNIPC